MPVPTTRPLSPLIVFLFAVSQVQASWFGPGAPALTGHRVEVSATQAVVSWETSLEGYSWAELTPMDGTGASRTAGFPGEESAREFSVLFEDLEPSQDFLLRFHFREQPWKEPTWTLPPKDRLPIVRTRPALSIHTVVIQERAKDHVTIRWKTSEPTDTRVRVGRVLDRMRVVENSDQASCRDHSLVVRDLNPNTVYHYQILAKSEGVLEEVTKGPEERFVTRAEVRGPEERPKPLYRRLSLPRSSSGCPLSSSEKQRLVNLSTGPSNFFDRRIAAECWISELKRFGTKLPDTPAKARRPELAHEVRYLKVLYEVNPERASDRLDLLIGILAEVEGIHRIEDG